MKNRAGIFVLISAGVIIGLLIAEILVRIFLPQNRLTTWIEMHPDGFMMNQKGVTAIHHFNERTAEYRLNQFGLRGYEHSPGNDLNILFLGDSFTFGLLLAEEDTFIATLQEKVNSAFPQKGINLLNGGVGGAGLADWPLWLEELGNSIAPDMIIYMMHTADIDRSISKNLFVVNEADSSLIQSQRWEPRQFLMRTGRQGWYRALQKRSDLMNLLVSIAWDKFYFKDQTNGFNQETTQVPIPSEEQRYIESGYSDLLGLLLFERLSNWCAENECTISAATTGFFGFGEENYYTYPFYQKISNQGLLSMSFFDNTRCMVDKTGGSKEQIIIEGDGHPNEKGAARIAECSWHWLQEVIREVSDEN
ncbi:MAG: SGNH/GDSL hydrolase family protein [Balneolaceae bacterium]|nr:MAG: SGNH/GDSL hydrolase family protein [Balneolaceae bacterium]